MPGFILCVGFFYIIKEYKAFKEEDIYEKIYSVFGSKHGIKKNQIKIESIEEISADEVEDPIVKAIL